jgi:hypothetical protein
MAERKLIGVSFNKEELAEFNTVKDTLGTYNDSKALKLCVTFTNNVINRLFGDKLVNIFTRSGRAEVQKRQLSSIEKMRIVKQLKAAGMDISLEELNKSEKRGDLNP